MSRSTKIEPETDEHKLRFKKTPSPLMKKISPAQKKSPSPATRSPPNKKGLLESLGMVEAKLTGKPRK